MILIAIGCLAPCLLMTVVLAIFARRTRAAGPGEAGEVRAHATGESPVRWDRLAEEIARSRRRRPRRIPGSVAARRHLAAVLPADARRR